jgi:hypothetical protein
MTRPPPNHLARAYDYPPRVADRLPEAWDDEDYRSHERQAEGFLVAMAAAAFVLAALVFVYVIIRSI